MASKFVYISNIAILFFCSLTTVDNKSMDDISMESVGWNSSGGGGLFDFNLDELEEEDESFLENGLCVPQDPIEDLEWFPNFKDDWISLNSCEETRKPRPSALKDGHGGVLMPNFSVTTKKPRSKRVSSGGAGSWKSAASIMRKENVWKSGNACGGKRVCSHCGVDSTPQWRIGPMGPKTLCNACGVRYKSGRLVPEYRPLVSPSFDGEMHSNSHKRIMTMRKTFGEIKK